MIVLAMILLGTMQGLFAQEDSTVHFSGNWVIEKAEVKVYAQRGGRLLEERTVTAEEQLRQIYPEIVLDMMFSGNTYALQFNSVMNQGTFSVVTGSLAMQSDVTGTLPLLWPYRFSGAKLIIEMPATYFKDMQRNEAVKQQVTCSFHKK